MSIQNFKSGNFATDTASDIISLWALVSNNSYSTFRRTSSGEPFPPNPAAGGGFAYSVTGGKTFRITRVRLHSNGSVTNYSGVSLFYSDNDLGWQLSTAPTNPKTLFGSTTGLTTFGLRAPIYNSGSEYGLLEFGGMIGPIPSGKFINGFFNNSDTGAAYIEGFES